MQLERLINRTVDEKGMPEDGGVEVRPLRPAMRLDPSAHELALLGRFERQLLAWGWELREGAGGLVGLESVPAVQGVELGAPAMYEYCASLQATDGGTFLPPPAVNRVLASKACRRAVMFGDALSTLRCQQILSDLARCDLPFICAHGRPTVVPALALDALPADVQLLG